MRGLFGNNDKTTTKTSVSHQDPSEWLYCWSNKYIITKT